VQRFFEDYKKLENKEVLVQDFLGPDEADKVIRRATELYSKLFSYMHRQSGPR
jgi:inorganic pyrophosphatase